MMDTALVLTTATPENYKLIFTSQLKDHGSSASLQSRPDSSVSSEDSQTKAPEIRGRVRYIPSSVRHRRRYGSLTNTTSPKNSEFGVYHRARSNSEKLASCPPSKNNMTQDREPLEPYDQ
jgi:hypothetical protein